MNGLKADEVLIVLYGIETELTFRESLHLVSLNRTLWN